jgi:glutathione S-transferase
MAEMTPRIPRLLSLRDRVAARPRIAAYLASSRRIPFNEDGIFRHYPELDINKKGAARRPKAR